MRCPNDCWTPAPDVVNVLVAIHVPAISTLGKRSREKTRFSSKRHKREQNNPRSINPAYLDPVKDNGLANHRLKRAHWRVDASRKQIFGLLQDLRVFDTYDVIHLSASMNTARHCEPMYLMRAVGVQPANQAIVASSCCTTPGLGHGRRAAQRHRMLLICQTQPHSILLCFHW